MKKIVCAAVTAAAAGILLCGIMAEAANVTYSPNVVALSETTSDSIIDILTQDKTTQYFTEDAVKTEDITTILEAGINAESGMNSQNWHFTALTTGSDILAEIVEEMNANRPAGAQTSGNAKAQMGDAPLNIVISCTEGSEFDAGLAAQNMAAAAQVLGYGVKIVSSPTIVLNGDKADYYKEQLGIPSDMQAEAVLLVGTAADTSDWVVDTFTSASVRNSFDEMATVIN